MKERVIGILLLALGAAAAYVSIYLPLEAASQHDESVSLFLYGAVFCPLFLVYGLLYLLMGQRVTGLLGTREKPTQAAIGIIILSGVVGIVIYLCLRAYLSSEGYQF